MIAMTVIDVAEIAIAMIAVIERAGHRRCFSKRQGWSRLFPELMSLPTP
jgi:hypothetical protein